MNIRTTVSWRGKSVPIEQVSDHRIYEAFSEAGKQVASKLACLRCPVHGKTASNVRLHFDAMGRADLKYDSCCERLGQEIGRALG